MTEQPKALWLAEYLENCRPEDAPVFATATELRRLHEVNAELLEALKHAENALADYVPTIEKTGAALNYGHHVIKMAKAAIAKALRGEA